MNGFTFRPVLTVFTLLGLAILISLGTWQMKRLQWKLDLIEQVEARTNAAPITLEDVIRRDQTQREYQPVKISGTFEHELEMHVFGTLEGEPGWYIMTPLRLAEETSGVFSADRLIINRGFVPERLKEREQRPESLVTGEVTLTGLYRSSKKPQGMAAYFAPSDMAPKERNEFYTRDVEAYQYHLDVALLPFLIDSSGAELAADWPKGGTTRLTFSNRHLEYALTWFGLAATLLAVFIVFSRKPVR